MPQASPVAAAPPSTARKARRWSWTLDAIVVFALAAVLIWPLFKSKYLDLWASIESTFIADARFLRDHWVHPNWQPNWYCGTRTDYVYPPALRYGTAALARYVPNMLPVRAYHLYVAFFYCFGIAAVYLLARYGSQSRAAGGLAALAAALVSPSYLFVASIRDDAPMWMPYRLNVLMRYGEGPHMTALAWLPIALLFSYLALQRWRPAASALAAIGCAMVVSNNFYGATSLAMLYPILVWSVYITHLDRQVWLRAAAVPALAYGLTAFWLTPSYLRITLDNMRFVSEQGNLWSGWVALATAIAFLLLSDHFARGRREQAWLVFLAGAAAAFFMTAVGNHYLGFRVIGEPGRLFPELDLILILFGVELLRRLWLARSRWPRLKKAAAVVIVLAAFAPSYKYLMAPRSIFVRDWNPEARVEYQLQDWMAKNMPESRAFVAGSVRFWYNVWNDLPQVGGGSEQGLLNPRVMPPQWELNMGEDPELSVLWLKILGADAIIVNGRNSREIYHDFVYPEKFSGVLPVLHDNGEGDTIYRVPRRFPGLARVVDREAHNALPEIPGNGELPQLRAWHEVVENGPDSPAAMQWENTDIARIQATIAPGESIWIAQSFDSNWRAYLNGERLSVRMDKLGFTVVDAPPGTHEIELRFPTPFANIVGRVITMLSFLCVAGLFWMGSRQ